MLVAWLDRLGADSRLRGCTGPQRQGGLNRFCGMFNEGAGYSIYARGGFGPLGK